MVKMNRFLVTTTVFLLILLIDACATVSPKRQDPLIGKIYRTTEPVEVQYSLLLKKALQSEVIYLGENHDNADHHAIQLKIIKDFVDKGKRPQLGFEFFSVDQTGYLNSFVAKEKSTRSGHSSAIDEKMLRSKLGWQNRTEKSWNFYFQFIQLAKEHHLQIFQQEDWAFIPII